MSRIIGKFGLLNVDGFGFSVEVLDVRERYGNTDVLVKPMCGDGQKWVQLNRVRLRD